MIQVPVQSVPKQTISVQLTNQSCQLKIYQTMYGLFMDVYVNNSLIIGGVVCQNLNRIVRNAYLGFVGDFVWFDTTKNGLDPIYTGLGTTFILIYVEQSEIDALGLPQ